MSGVHTVPDSVTNFPDIDPDQVEKARSLWRHTVEQAIATEKGRLKELEKHLKELEQAQSTLAALSSKIAHNVMVPFGRVAMFPGQLVHTNEVLLRLGADNFIETSSKHAQQVLHRREEYVQEQLSRVHTQLEALQGRLAFAVAEVDEAGEPVRDICEAYDEAEHGPLEGPSVRPEVVRRRYGPPRNAAEAAEEDDLMQRLREYVARAPDGATAADTCTRPEGDACDSAEALMGSVARVGGLGAGNEEAASRTGCGADSQAAPLRSAQPGTSEEDPFLAAADQDALGVELDRLAGAFDQIDPEPPHGDRKVLMAAAAPAGPTRAAVGPLVTEVAAAHGLPAGGSEAVASTRGAAEPSASRDVLGQGGSEKAWSGGLRKGFLAGKQPVKGILRRTAEVGREGAVEGRQAGPRVSTALLTKNGPTDAEKAAFSGIVQERKPPGPDRASGSVPLRAQSTQGAAGPRAQRISQFKSRMAEGRQT